MYFICKFCKLFVNIWKVGEWRVMDVGKWGRLREGSRVWSREVGIRWRCGVGTTDPFSTISGNLIHILPPVYEYTVPVSIWKKSADNGIL